MKIDYEWKGARPAELCQLAGRWKGEAVEPGTVAEAKIDGWRALYFRGLDGKPRLWTRGGHEIGGVSHILHRISIMEAVAGEPLFIDGEFQVDGTLPATKRWCESGWKTGDDKGTFHAFDCMTEAEWQSNRCERPLYERKAMLERLHRAALDHPLSWEFRPGTHGREPDGPIVEIMREWWVSDAGEVDALAARVWSAGGEGLMLKDPMAPYRRNRSSDWRKVKYQGYVPGKRIEWENI